MQHVNKGHPILHLGFSCLQMGWARIPKINTNIYSVTRIFVFKSHKDRMTQVIAQKTISSTDKVIAQKPFCLQTDDGKMTTS